MSLEHKGAGKDARRLLKKQSANVFEECGDLLQFFDKRCGLLSLWSYVSKCFTVSRESIPQRESPERAWRNLGSLAEIPAEIASNLDMAVSALGGSYWFPRRVELLLW